ncbi:MAG: hypothetical protein ACOYOZ_15720, partial [Pirellula sp.]
MSPTDPVFLSFNYILETDGLPGRDIAEVVVHEQGGIETLVATNRPLVGQIVSQLADPTTANTLNPWRRIEIDLSRYAGKYFHLQFKFNTVEGGFNTHKGFHIDDVVLTSRKADIAFHRGNPAGALYQTGPLTVTAGDFDANGRMDLAIGEPTTSVMLRSGSTQTTVSSDNRGRVAVFTDIDTTALQRVQATAHESSGPVSYRAPDAVFPTGLSGTHPGGTNIIGVGGSGGVTNPNTARRQYTYAMFFELPEIANLQTLDEATLQLSILAKTSDIVWGFDVDLYGLGYVDEPVLSASWQFAGDNDTRTGNQLGTGIGAASVTKIVDSFIPEGSSVGNRTVSGPSLVAFLRSLYAAGARGGDYAVLRLNMNANVPPELSSGTPYWTMSADGVQKLDVIVGTRSLPDSRELHLDQADKTIRGTASQDRFGWLSTTPNLDFNFDGIADLLIGASTADQGFVDNGKVSALQGRSNAFRNTLPAAPTVLANGNPIGGNSYMISPSEGQSVTFAGGSFPNNTSADMWFQFGVLSDGNSSDFIQVTSNDPFAGAEDKLVFDLFDAAGRPISIRKSTADLRRLPAGFYLLRVYDAGSSGWRSGPLPYSIHIAAAPLQRPIPIVDSAPFHDRDVLDGGSGDDTLVGNGGLDRIYDRSGTNFVIAESTELMDYAYSGNAITDPPSGQLAKNDKYTSPNVYLDIGNYNLRIAIASLVGVLGPTQVLLRPLTQKDLNELTALDLSGRNIANLSGLNAANRLVSLNVANNPLNTNGAANSIALNGLLRLRTLNVSGTGLTDF